MKWLLSVLVGLLLLAQLCWADGPGAGGVMACSAINGMGGAIIGTDNGGLYYRTDPGDHWTRVGNVHGINTNNIECVAFGRTPKFAVAGGHGALAFTTNFGASRTWTAVTAISPG